MLEEKYYTFKEIAKKYNWPENISGLPKQQRYAEQHGIRIIPEFRKQATYFSIKEIKLVTKQELIEKYGWSSYILKSNTPKNEQDNYAKVHGMIIKRIATNLYEIIEDNNKKVYTWLELICKYKWDPIKASVSANKRILFAQHQNIEIEQTGVSNKVAYYYVKSEKCNEDWIVNDKYPDFEFNKKLGLVRNKETKHIYKSKTTSGYLYIKYQKQYFLQHRILMEVFNPIDNMHEMTVDHINGVRTDNRLENLRWVSLSENNKIKVKNRKAINERVEQLLAKYGYDGLIDKMQDLLNP